MTRLFINLLGPFQATVDGETLRGFESDKVRALLAYLAVEAGRPHRREALAGLLWPDQSDLKARNSLRTALSNLRQTIGDPSAAPPFLEISRDFIQFNTASDFRLDLADFLRLLAECEQHHHRRLDSCLACAQRQEAAAALYRDEFLAGFSLADSPLFEAWTVSRREQWHRQALTTFYNLANYYERRGEYGRAYQYAARQIALEPWREEAHRQAMRALAFDGQRSAALAQYERCRDILATELGVPPASETALLYERIRFGTLENTPADRRISGTVAESTTSLVGREKELTEIREALLDPNCHLLTLTGLAGIGKTRLAQEVTRQMELDFPHGAAFVSLASLSSKRDAVPAVTDVLGLRLQGGQPEEEQLFAFLREKELLLVLDNFEQLLPGTELLLEIMQRAPGVVLLVTSRQRLNLQAEWVFDLSGLHYPAWSAAETIEGYSAVQLFVQRARQVKRGFSLSADDRLPVAHICRLCEGMPLAIELAAAALRYQSCAQIAGQLQTNWQALAATYDDLPKRHHSVHAAFEHSWALLSTAEQAVFAGLSLFRGGFDAEAAASIAHASSEILHALLDKSLVQRAGDGRFGMHPLLQQYAAEKLRRLGLYEQTADRHSAYYCAFLHEHTENWHNAHQLETLAAVTREADNARPALYLALEQKEWQRLLQAFECWAWYHKWQGRYAYLEALCQGIAEKAKMQTAQGTSVSPDCLRLWVRTLIWQSDSNVTSVALNKLEQSLELLERPELRGQDTRPEKALLFRMKAAKLLDVDWQEARQYSQQSLVIYRQLDDQSSLASCLVYMSLSDHASGDYHPALEKIQIALAIHKERGDRREQAKSMGVQGLIRRNLGHLEEAERLHREALSLAQQIGDRSLLQQRYRNLAYTLLWQGKFEDVRQLAQKALEICQESGHWVSEGAACAILCLSLVHAGQYQEARQQANHALSVVSAVGDRGSEAIVYSSLGLLALAESSYARAQAAFTEIIEIIPAVRQIQIQVEMALVGLSYATFRLGQLSHARKCLAEAFSSAVAMKAYETILFALPCVALFIPTTGDTIRAVEIWALAKRHPYIANSKWFEDVAGRELEAVAASLPPEVEEATRARGQTLDLWETAEALLTTLRHAT